MTIVTVHYRDTNIIPYGSQAATSKHRLMRPSPTGLILLEANVKSEIREKTFSGAFFE